MTQSLSTRLFRYICQIRPPRQSMARVGCALVILAAATANVMAKTDGTSHSLVNGQNSARVSSAVSGVVADVVSSVRARYKISRNGFYIGQVDEVFTRLPNNRYLITSHTRPEGVAALMTSDQLTLTSEGRITANGLVPAIFSSKRKKETKRNFVSRFDWASGELVRESQRNGDIERESFELANGTLDRLASMYQFMLLTPNATISTLMTQGKEAETYRYVRQATVTVNTEAGDYDALHYTRDAKQGESKADIWLAKSKNHVPIRIIFEDSKGVKLEQALVSLVVE